MALQISRLYDFQPGTKILSGQIDAEFNQLVNAHNTTDTELTTYKDLIKSVPGSNEVGSSVVGLVGATVQSVLNSMKVLVDSKSDGATTDAALLLKSDKTVTNLHIKNVSFNTLNGEFTFTREDGTTVVIDTPMEKLAVNFSYDSTTEELVLVLADGTTQRISLSSLISTTDFIDTATISWSVVGSQVKANINNGSITDEMLSSSLVTLLQNYVSAASTSATNALQSATAAELSETLAAAARDAAINAKNQAENAKDSAQQFQTGAQNAQGGAILAQQNAQSFATQSGNQARMSESWAVGGTGARVGENTNNAKYWSEQAQAAAGGGVTSFNGRTGPVAPMTGDYTPEMVGADPSGSAEAVQTNLDNHTIDGVKHITAAERTSWNGKAAGDHTHTASDVGAVPTTRKVNNKALSEDVTLTAADVGAQDAATAINTGNIANQNVNTATYAQFTANRSVIPGHCYLRNVGFVSSQATPAYEADILWQYG